ncbi:MAG: hydrolase [Rhodobiaceae bacterium]|nr:hydrolase [Rhodobiaceae bacterium]RPF95988.1 MAG: FAA hydrolase family protein [Rhizobiales bacterium TMED227]|tara:strand:- start:3 stop:887 length:885 start_codon:yes stop_codon:yes gene_type:complete
MRLVTYVGNSDNTKTGLLTNDRVVPLEQLGISNDMNEIIKDFQKVKKIISENKIENLKILDLSDIKLLAPIPRPLRNIMCVGKNYHDHAQEFYGSGFDSSGKKAVADFPVIFTKATTSVIATDENIILANDYTNTTDYEGELGLILSKGGKNIKPEDAYDYIFGYTIINDVSARNIQKQHEQWFIGKSPDTYCPMGPSIVTSDEIGDVTKLKLKTTVNGEVRQDSIVERLIFDIPTLLSTISKTMTLEVCDIIATGTPAGVGIGFEPPVYLKSGDQVEVSIDKLGVLRNAIKQN